jgi:RHS repeat-associated protein
VNPFTLKGNASRKVTDLSMTGSEPLDWIRHHNTMPRMIIPAFGRGGSWRHNWQYELQVRGGGKGRQLLFISPSGIRRSFRQQADGSFATLRERYQEKARAIGDRLEITTPEEDTLVFEPAPARAPHAPQAGAGLYRAVTLTNKDGQVTRFDYDGNGLLQSITNEAGNQITLHYDDRATGCISRVGTSDGRAVEYEYENMAGPREGQEYATLARARYGDGTSAEYKYDIITADQAPLLVEADDPRYDGRARHVGYRYQKGKGMKHGVIHEEYNPATGQAYVSLEFDSKDREKRIVRYTDDRTITYRVPGNTNGRATERIDSLGRRQAWSFDNGGAGALMEKTSADGKSVRYTRDKKGKITRASHSDGLVIDIERDHSGHVAKTRDNRGRATGYVRDSRGRVLETSKTFAGSQSFRPGKVGSRQNSLGALATKTRRETVRLDTSGRPLRQNYADGTYEEFTRDKKGNILTKRDRKGRVSHYTHAERGLVASETDPAGGITRYGYNRHGQRNSQTDALGRVTAWDHDERGLVTRLVNADGTERVYAYDKYGRKISETDEIGRTASWQYDNLTRLVSQTDFAGGVTRFDYTETPGGCGTCSLVSNPTRITHPDGRIDEFLYDTEGRMLMRSVAVGTAHMAVTLYAYDDADNLIRQTNPDGGVIKHTYDINKRRLSTTNALGHTTSWTYDDEGNMLSRTDASGRTTDHAYDADNNLIYTVTADGAETTHEYDAANRRTSTTDAMGNTTRWNYNDAGELVSVIDAAGGETRHAYDSAGRRIRTDFPDGTNQTWTYNAIGQVSQTTTADGLKVENEYDNMGHLIATVGAPLATPSSAATTRYTYDAAGRRTSITDPLNRTTRYEYNTRSQVAVTIHPDNTRTQKKYDDSGRVVADIDQLGHATQYTYTPLGDMATLTDANGNTYSFTYDVMRRKTAMIYPDDSREQWVHDLGGRLASYITRAGQAKTITYNADSRPLSETWKPAGCAPDVIYTYDGNGRLASADNGNALLTYTYDKLGRITSETTDIRALLPNMAPHTVGYLYDFLGRKAGLVYPDGMKVTHAYDAQSRMTEVYNGNNKPLAVYEYDAHGRRSKLTRDNGVITNYAYDAASQILAIDHLGRGNTPLSYAHYEYDNMGRRSSVIREDNQTDRYRYDATSQLTGVDYGNSTGNHIAQAAKPAHMSFRSTETFTYDPLGNRIEHTDATSGQLPLVEYYKTNNLNQYTQITSSLPIPRSSLPIDGAISQLIGTTPGALPATEQDESNNTPETQTSEVAPTARSLLLIYDFNGNLINDGTQRYRYDAQNRLIEVESATVRALFDYDVRNRCVLRHYFTRTNQGQGDWIKNENDSLAPTYDLVWDILVDRNIDGRQTAAYIHGNHLDEILVNIQEAKTYYPHGDVLGSTIALTTDNGKLESAIKYTVYGGAVGAPEYYRFLYTGREWLASVALNDHRNRYYSLKFGRWVSKDPRYFIDGLNIYAYVHNAPINMLDRQGTISCNACESMVSNAFADNAKTKRLARDLLDNGCWSIVECTGSQPADDRGAEYNPTTGKITMFAPKIRTGTYGIQYLVHEMVHALDDCLERLTDSDENYACSEIRAYDYSGMCAGQTGTAYKNCVIDYAERSMELMGKDKSIVGPLYNDCTGGW